MEITGKDLIRLGYKPAPWFKQALDKLNEFMRYPTEEEIRGVCDLLLPPPALELRESAAPYRVFMTSETDAEIENELKVIQTMDEVMRLPTVVRGAVMPDACPAGPIGTIPVGGVVVTQNAIHPGMHSADICCSVMATNFGQSVHPSQVLDAVHKWTHFGPGGRKEPVYTPSGLLERVRKNPITRDFEDKAIYHMATQGDGNHFSFVGRSKESNHVYLVTHHGSRGFGASVYKRGLKIANKYRKILAPSIHPRNAWIPYDTEDGKNYWEALQIVRDWTKHNHKMIHFLVEIGAPKSKKFEQFWNEHNFVFQNHAGYFWHAKGATPMIDRFVPDNPTGLRLIPLNMKDGILIAMAPKELNYGAQGFAPHGAGRNISRSAYKKLLADMDMEHDAFLGWTDEDHFHYQTKGLDVRSFSGKPDVSELPGAYKNADQVIRDIRKYDLAQQVDIIEPYGCIMAGELERPWKRKNKK